MSNCQNCGLQRATEQERSTMGDKARRAYDFTKIIGGGADGFITGLLLAGARPRCWHRDAESCAQWQRWEAEDKEAER